MSKIQELKNQLINHNQITARLIGLPDSDEKIREFMRRILQLQIECEEYRNNLRRTFLCTELRETWRIVGEYKNREYRSINNWEPVNKEIFRMIDEKEINGTAYYESKIKELYEASVVTTRSIKNSQPALPSP